MNLINDSYYEIKEGAESIFKDKGSKHFGYIYPVHSKDEIDQRLTQLRKKHHSARHICYAWTIGNKNPQTKYSDDGEPHNSAGPPILGQIQSFKLHNTLIAVVRYFGGTKLGVSGLINAYRTAAKEAIENGKIIIKYRTQHIVLTFPYNLISELMRFAKQDGVDIIRQDFSEICVLEIDVREKYYEDYLKKLRKLHPLKIDTR